MQMRSFCTFTAVEVQRTLEIARFKQDIMWVDSQHLQRGPFDGAKRDHTAFSAVESTSRRKSPDSTGKVSALAVVSTECCQHLESTALSIEHLLPIASTTKKDPKARMFVMVCQVCCGNRARDWRHVTTQGEQRQLAVEKSKSCLLQSAVFVKLAQMVW